MMMRTIFVTGFIFLLSALTSFLRAQIDVEASEAMFDLEFSEEERSLMESGLKDNLAAYKSLHQYSIANSIPPAVQFNLLPVGFTPDNDQKEINWDLPDDIDRPDWLEDLAFYSVADLASLVRRRKVTSLELTEFFLARLKEFGDTLECVITITEELALEQARRADQELAANQYRGPLHGIPYGLKDLFAVEGYKTTWGAMPFKDQMINENATVYNKLTEAGAVLVAKLTLGALAWGDVWYGGITKNPWKLDQGSSGSSAGSASATAAGLVPFAIGTETLGSIVSPSNRCGTTGLRPTFGRVSRAGGMNLSWTMDKVGPICRSALDCALVFDAIRGVDGLDQAVTNAAFNYQPIASLEGLKVGYLKHLFDQSGNPNDSASLEIIKGLGANLEPLKLPDDLPLNTFGIILSTEAAAAFDELTRSNRDSLMVRQIKRAWPNVFRQSRFVPAVEYINANRVRYQLIQRLHALFKDFDVIITPSFGGNQLQFTNLTGHPVVVVPNGFNNDGTPTSISFLGNLFDEATILSVARLFQEKTDYHLRHPDMFED